MTSWQLKFLALCVSFLATACLFRSDRYAPSEPEVSSPQTAEIKKSYENSPSDSGDFSVEYVKSQLYTEYETEFRENKVLEKAADKLNRSLALPQDVKIIVQECGKADAYYDPKSKKITICLDLIEHFRKLFLTETVDEKKAKQKALDAMRFVFLHELGHALIDVYNLPITGNEEDAADRLSSFICLDKLGEDGVRAILAAADAFKIEAKQNKPMNLADDHLLEQQRFYTSLCLIYGSDPEKYAHFVTEKYLPADRAKKCPEEYEKMVRSWTELLARWRKD